MKPTDFPISFTFAKNLPAIASAAVAAATAAVVATATTTTTTTAAVAILRLGLIDLERASVDFFAVKR
jgi:hypothetical protein